MIEFWVRFVRPILDMIRQVFAASGFNYVRASVSCGLHCSSRLSAFPVTVGFELFGQCWSPAVRKRVGKESAEGLSAQSLELLWSVCGVSRSKASWLRFQIVACSCFTAVA